MKRSGIRSKLIATSGMRYSFNPACRIIPRTPEPRNAAGRITASPFVSPFVRPRPFVMPFVRPSPFVNPFVRPRPFVSPPMRRRPFVRPFVSPFVRPFVLPRSPFVRPPGPFVFPPWRDAPRLRRSPFVSPLPRAGFATRFGSGFASTSTSGFAGGFVGTGTVGAPPSSSWTISWIAACPRSSKSSSSFRVSANRAPQLSQRVASTATGASHIGHGTVGPATFAASSSASSARRRLCRARSACPRRAWSFVFRTQRPG